MVMYELYYKKFPKFNKNYIPNELPDDENFRDILEKYPWLTADNVYVRKWGRTYKTLQKAWIGQMYIIKLKQSPVRGHSVRSTGALDTKGLPTRSYRSRSHLEQYSGTPIRFNNSRAEISVMIFSKTPLIAGKSL